MLDLEPATPMGTQFINIAAYKFVALDQLSRRREELLEACRSEGLKGTILLSSEGINCFLAGRPDGVEAFLGHLRSQEEFRDLEVKESFSDHQPFSRMLVRLKKEIISLGIPEVRPSQKTSPKISAHQLKSWLDEGKEITLLDVRNDYEFEVGTFASAIPLPIDHFREFPQAIKALPEALRQKPIVMFCTGGIRCEKAGPLMESAGFAEIYQLDGGILKYFEECGGAHYRGDCFVFDKRVALDPQLQQTGLAQCYRCQAILSIENQQSELYDPPRACQHCHPHALPMQERLAQRGRQLRDLTTPLPGSVPYENARPMSVTTKFDEQPLIDFLITIHAGLDREYWQTACEQGRVRYRNHPLGPEQVVRAGWRLYHLIPGTVEPHVANEIEFLYEDKSLIAINKPAPLPMHPCGRFNKNTLQNFLRMVYPHETIRILHRLDAETTGVLILGRDRLTTARVHQQFASGTVGKTYLARVFGHPNQDEFECTAALTGKASGIGGIRQVVGQNESTDHFKAKLCITRFTVLKRFEDSTALIECTPLTGRTNQIRVHLAYLGFPIIGDAGYNEWVRLSASEVTQGQPFAVNENASRQSQAWPARNCDPAIILSERLNLHAYQLEIEYPPKQRMSFKADPPAWATL